MPKFSIDKQLRGDPRRVLDALVDHWLETTEKGKHMTAAVGSLTRARTALYELHDKNLVVFEAGEIAEDGTMPFRVRPL